jgi:hypothetical protein
MSRLLLSLLLFLPGGIICAQSRVPDLVLTDCNNVPHSLHAELEEGRTIVLQIIDPKSQTTLAALRGMENLIGQYKSSNPERIYSYLISADASTGCDDMPVSLSSFASNFLQFTGGSQLTELLKITSLPAVVVMGNSNHTIYGSFSGYTPAKDVAIRAAVEESLAENGETGSSGIIKNSLGTVFPNPFTTSLNVRLHPSATATRAAVCDLTGKALLMKDFSSEKLINFNTSTLQKGIYFLNFYQGEKISSTLKLVKRQ